MSGSQYRNISSWIRNMIRQRVRSCGSLNTGYRNRPGRLNQGNGKQSSPSEAVAGEKRDRETDYRLNVEQSPQTCPLVLLYYKLCK